MQVPRAHAASGDDSSGKVVKLATFGAIVAIFGGAVYFLGGKSSQDPVGTPATPPSVAAAAKAAPARAGDQAVAPAQAAAVPASDQPVQAAAAAAPRAEAPAPVAGDVAQPASLPEPARPAQAAAAVAAFSPAEDAVPEAAPAPAHQAAHKKLHVAATPPADKPADSGAAAAQPGQPDAVSILNPWWQGAEAQPFRITAVSPAKDSQALVVVFSQPVDQAAGNHLKLLNNDGSAASGSWTLGANPRVLVRNGVAPGRYMLFVDGAAASVDGKPLGSDMSGPVYVLASRGG
jgi:hypothetical protein